MLIACDPHVDDYAVVVLETPFAVLGVGDELGVRQRSGGQVGFGKLKFSHHATPEPL